MPVIQDRDVDANSAMVERDIVCTRDALGASFNATIRKLLLGRAFTIKRVTAWASTASAGTRIDVKIGGVSALAAAVIPGIGGAAPAVVPLGAVGVRSGTSTQALEVTALTQAAEAATDITVVVTVRYRAHRGDPGTT